MTNDRGECRKRRYCILSIYTFFGRPLVEEEEVQRPQVQDRRMTVNKSDHILYNQRAHDPDLPVSITEQYTDGKTSLTFLSVFTCCITARNNDLTMSVFLMIYFENLFGILDNASDSSLGT